MYGQQAQGMWGQQSAYGMQGGAAGGYYGAQQANPYGAQQGAYGAQAQAQQGYGGYYGATGASAAAANPYGQQQGMYGAAAGKIKDAFTVINAQAIPSNFSIFRYILNQPALLPPALLLLLSRCLPTPRPTTMTTGSTALTMVRPPPECSTAPGPLLRERPRLPASSSPRWMPTAQSWRPPQLPPSRLRPPPLPLLRRPRMVPMGPTERRLLLKRAVKRRSMPRPPLLLGRHTRSRYAIFFYC